MELIIDSTSAIKVLSASSISVLVFLAVLPRHLLLFEFGIHTHLTYVMFQMVSWATKSNPCLFLASNSWLLNYPSLSVLSVIHYWQQKSLFHYLAILIELNLLNLCNTIMNESASIVLVISIWTAQLVKHVKRAAKRLRSHRLSLIKFGPNLLTPE